MHAVVSAMWTRTARLVIFVPVLLVGCGTPEAPSAADTATVHGAVLGHLLANAGEEKIGQGRFVIRKMSAVDIDVLNQQRLPPDMPLGFVSEVVVTWQDLERDHVRGSLPGLRPETWDDFVRANEKPQDLTQIIRFSGRVTYITEDALSDLFGTGRDDGYERFFQRYPDARELTAMSLPGMSASGDQALLYVESMCGYLAGTGMYYLLIREDGGWKIVDEFMSWIA